MLRRSTWIMLLIFAVLAGFAFFYQRYQANHPEETATPVPTTSQSQLYNVESSQVSEVSIADSSGKQLSLYKDENKGQWAIRDYQVEQVDSFQIDSIIAQLLSMQVQETLVQPPPLEVIGLDAPGYTITIMMREGSQLVTFVGTPTPVGGGYYVQLNSNQVVIVDKITLDNVLNWLFVPPLVPTPTPGVVSTGTVSPTEGGSGVTPAP
jgi:hypothetical protein